MQVNIAKKTIFTPQNPLQMNSRGNILALTPLALFLGIYFIGSVIVGDFYKIPITVAALAASICAVAMSTTTRAVPPNPISCS